MKISLNNITDHLKNHYDVFIASASYEERCLSVINSIEQKIELNNKFVSLSIPHKDLISGNLEIFEKKGFSIIEISNTDQITTINNLIQPVVNILEKNLNASFLIDITTFTRQTLLILLRVLRNMLTPKNKIEFIYAPASEYSIGCDYKDKWLTRGILGVNSVFGYSGIIRPSRPYHLIILVGFEVERAASLIDAYEPSKITIGYAKKSDSLSEENYKLNKEKYEELLCEYPTAEFFEFSCIKVDECKTDILKQASKYQGHNVIISPMNNKISTVACALAAFENDEIQVAIAIPALYNHENYSAPGDCCHILEISDFIK